MKIREAKPHASLPMYDWPETAPAWDRFWEAIRAELAAAGIETETALRRRDDQHHGWLSPGLLLGQACGWPYMLMLRGQVVPIGRFDFGLPTNRAGDYYSVFITCPDMAGEITAPRDLAPLMARNDAIIAVNSMISQSGYRVLGECVPSPLTVPRGRILTTGSHRESIRAVADGRAHVAAIDAASWLLAQEHEPAVEKVAVAARSGDAPGLPLIVANRLRGHRKAVGEALTKVAANLADDIRSTLKLRGIAPASDEDYHVLERPPYGNLRIG